MRTDEPTPLLEKERALLNAILEPEFTGVTELREQARHVLAKRGCTCGCGTIDFEFSSAALPLSNAASPVPVNGVVRHADGEEIGGLILFVTDGRLGSLEIYSYDDPLPLPDITQVEWIS